MLIFSRQKVYFSQVIRFSQVCLCSPCSDLERRATEGVLEDGHSLASTTHPLPPGGATLQEEKEEEISSEGDILLLLQWKEETAPTAAATAADSCVESPVVGTTIHNVQDNRL